VDRAGETQREDLLAPHAHFHTDRSRQLGDAAFMTGRVRVA
jgi:hypothetical protein